MIIGSEHLFFYNKILSILFIFGILSLRFYQFILFRFCKMSR